MSYSPEIANAATLLVAAKQSSPDSLTRFIGLHQRLALMEILTGEEGEGMAKLVTALPRVIAETPRTYQQDGKGMDAIAHLHYFGPNVDVWITELDSLDLVTQAFGYTRFAGDDGELGYIHIPELLGVNLELDLHWTPKTLKEAIKA